MYVPIPSVLFLLESCSQVTRLILPALENPEVLRMYIPIWSGNVLNKDGYMQDKNTTIPLPLTGILSTLSHTVSTAALIFGVHVSLFWYFTRNELLFSILVLIFSLPYWFCFGKFHNPLTSICLVYSSISGKISPFI